MSAVGRCRVFARVPPELARYDRPCPWSMAVLGQERIGSFLEGPCFTPDGTLCTSRISRTGGSCEPVTKAGWRSTCDYGGAPNGMAALPDGSLLIADYERGLLRLGADRTLTTLADRFRHEPFLGLSDIVIGRDGAVYISDQGQSDQRRPVGRVFRLAAERLP